MRLVCYHGNDLRHRCLGVGVAAPYCLLQGVLASSLPPPSACAWGLQRASIGTHWKHNSLTSPMIVTSILDTSLCTRNLTFLHAAWKNQTSPSSHGAPHPDCGRTVTWQGTILPLDHRCIYSVCPNKIQLKIILRVVKECGSEELSWCTGSCLILRVQSVQTTP